MTTHAHGQAVRASGARLKTVAVFFPIAVLAAGAGFAQAQTNPADPFLVADFNCADMAAHSIEKQVNMRADAIRDKCRVAKTELEAQLRGDAGRNTDPAAILDYGGPDANVHPSNSAAIQSESQSFRFGNTIVVTFNDISGGSTGKGSYSTDGGATFTRLAGDPFGVGHGANFGDPGIVYDAAHGKWVATFLAAGCGGQGVGAWNSNDGITWATAGCAANAGGGNGDRNALWVDNNPASPFYGRIYNSYNDFGIGGGALRTTFSTDGGTTWSAPTNVFASFRRDIALAVAPNGDVYLAGMDEGTGGGSNRTNFMHRSTNGAVSWLAGVAQGAPFAPPGNTNCTGNTYFRTITPQIRHMGWGQPAAGPGNVVHYVYAGHGSGSDEGNIFYVRSTDNGATWSAPFQLNTDAGTRAQWMPSLAVTADGAVFSKWYDRRDTANNDYWIYGRASLDNGLTWQADQPVSDAVIPQPLVQTSNCYMGDYDFWEADGIVAQGSWTDSRGVGSGGTQDLFHDGADLPVGVNVTPPTQSVCAPADAVYNVDVTTFFTSAVTLSASGQPAGTTASFVPNPVSPPGSSTFTIGNTGAAAVGTYPVNVLGTAGPQSSNQTVTLNLFDAAPAAPTLTAPPDGAVGVNLTPTFTWTASPQAASYTLEIATDAGFGNIVHTASNINGTSYNGANLIGNTTYFWRVRGVNACGTGSNSPIFSFTTINLLTCQVGANYTTATAAGTIVPGVTDIGNHVDDATTTIALPFPVAYYDQIYSSINVDSNGTAQFVSNASVFTNTCPLPDATRDTLIFPHWDDLRTDANPGCAAFPGGLCGIFTATTGAAPNRIFRIEWRTVYFAANSTTANFELNLHESDANFEVVYGTLAGGGTSASVGCQRDIGSLFTQFSCNSAVPNNTEVSYTCALVPVELMSIGVQ